MYAHVHIYVHVHTVLLTILNGLIQLNVHVHVHVHVHVNVHVASIWSNYNVHFAGQDRQDTYCIYGKKSDPIMTISYFANT